jgi:hypothetical protein
MPLLLTDGALYLFFADSRTGDDSSMVNFTCPAGGPL